ncbi:MAG: RNA-binding protein [Candidatus Obscuribacterales bacterium]|nr:RNA-binding protein [Candidatus Obscuribacterales bacterium]
MNNKLFIGNLSYGVTDHSLGDLFSQYGEVVSCSIAKDRDTGRSRGFAFVEMQTQEQAEAAIQGLNGHTLENRQISVAISQPKPKGAGGGRNRY